MFTVAFWRAAGLRALQTVLVALVPFLAPLMLEPSAEQFVQAGLALVLTAALSVATSLASLPEAGGGERPRWRAILSRTVRSFGQVFAAALGAAATFDEVAWAAVAGQAAVAAATTLVRTIVASLPEVPDPSPAPPAPSPQLAVGDRVRVRRAVDRGGHAERGVATVDKVYDEGLPSASYVLAFRDGSSGLFGPDEIEPYARP